MEAVSTENGTKKSLSVSPVSKNVYWLQTFQSSLNLLAHIMIGFVVGANLIYSFRSGLPLRTTPIHIVLCVIGSYLNLLVHVLISFVVGGTLLFVFKSVPPYGATSAHIVLCVLGYHLFMAEAILSLCSYNRWSAKLKLIEKRRVHWILQTFGSGLAVVGSVIKILNKSVNFNTLHGQFALVALICTSVSLVNGLASLWAYEIRKKIPISAKLPKLTHICSGMSAFMMAAISLCYGFEKKFFREKLGDGVGYTLIAFTVCLTVIIISNPLITLMTKLRVKEC